MGSEDVKVTAMNMYKYKERLRLYKRWPCSTYILVQFSSVYFAISIICIYIYINIQIMKFEIKWRGSS